MAARAASSDRAGLAIYAQNNAKRPYTGILWAFVGAFGFLYVFAVALFPLSLEKKRFLARLWVWGESWIGFGVFLGLWARFWGFPYWSRDDVPLPYFGEHRGGAVLPPFSLRKKFLQKPRWIYAMRGFHISCILFQLDLGDYSLLLHLK